MREPYGALLSELRSELANVGLVCSLLRDEDWLALLLLDLGWGICFEGERYYGPAFTISVSPGGKNSSLANGFAVWLLMKLVENQTGRAYGPPTIKNQVKFLSAEREFVFDRSIKFREGYEQLNGG